MGDPLERCRRFLRELKRRNVYKVAATYTVVGFVLIQAANLIFPALNIPSWAYSLVVILILFGFPIALIMAWAFEMSPDGMRRTPEAGEATAEPSSGGVEGWLVVLGILLLAGGGAWYLTVGGDAETATESAATTDTTAARTASTARDTSGPPRIAVLPFENIAPDSAEDYFAQGMHEEVLNQLSKVSGLEVISRTSVMGYADTQKRVPEISRELGGVDALLEGTVRRAGDQVRITTQLIRAPDDEHLWSNTYERQLAVEEIFDVQADIAHQISGALETQLAGGERERIEEAPTDNLAAYDAYLKGRNQLARFYDTRNPVYTDQGIEHLRDAVQLDSTFAQAYAWLANGYRRRSSGEDRWRDSASAALERARALAPDLTDVLLAQAYSYDSRGSLKAAENLYEEILRREPSNVRASMGLAGIAWDSGDPVEGIRWRHRAIQLAPRDPGLLGTMGFALGSIGMVEAGEAWYGRAIKIEPERFVSHAELALIQAQESPETALGTLRPFIDEHPHALWFSGRIALLAGQPEQARSYLERVPDVARQFYPDDSPSPLDQMDPFGWLRWVSHGLAELHLGNRGRGRQLLRQAADSLRARVEGDGAREWGYTVRFAGTLAALGDRESALRTLDEGLSRTVPVVGLVPLLPAELSSPFFADLQSDPRFQKIVAEVDARREKIREEVRQLDLDLYPPGAESDSVTVPGQTDG